LFAVCFVCCVFSVYVHVFLCYIKINTFEILNYISRISNSNSS
jgi:hypothetical protein